MKKFAKTLIAGALLSTAAISQSAMAEQKIGVVDVEGVFAQLPQAATVQQTIAAEFKDRQDELKALQGDIEYEMNKRQRESATMSEAQLQALDAKIMEMRQNFAAKAQPLQQEVQARLNQERNKLTGYIQQAIQVVASEGDYDVILKGSSIAFSKPEYDLSEKVLEKASKIK
ncbi:OmpH family outer membrane protein [Aestuariibacter halophilus]|uniref:OmpH family outer membrane protein n=1 Tax=Fluctibacter halophilus TaxID=226011 RepID=A0ABS8GCF1_9ALTE|nr:OmpH family outer membrane protein [Aestuariibacter halophilus]MCC2618173.1 OmpH family outer membrane protein [Aestuariibacter halophilus]